MIGFIVNYSLFWKKTRLLSLDKDSFLLSFHPINSLFRYQKHFGEHIKLSDLGLSFEIYSEKNKEIGGKMKLETAPETELEYSVFSWIDFYNTKKPSKSTESVLKRVRSHNLITLEIYQKSLEKMKPTVELLLLSEVEKMKSQW